MAPLKFKCAGCGECCTHLVGDRFGMIITVDEWRVLNKIAYTRGIKFEAVPFSKGIIGTDLYQFTQKRCPFHDARSKRCSIYEHRPTVCRMFPVHPYGLFSCPALERITKMFPGVPVNFDEEIKKALRFYNSTIQPRIQGARLVNDLNRGLTNPSRERPIIQRIEW